MSAPQPPPTIEQKLIVPGEIWIQSSTGYRELSGRIAFIGPLERFYGQLRVIGTSGNYTFLADTTGANRGFCVRGEDTQGELAIPQYGYSKPYVLQASGETVTAYRLDVNTAAFNTTNPYQFGQPSFSVLRNGTKDTTNTVNVLAALGQQNWKSTGETITLTIGPNTYGGGCGYIGYYSTSSSPSNADRQFLIGINNQNVNINAIVINPTGSLSIPVSLTTPTATITALSTTTVNATSVSAQTVSATNYVGLPPPNVTPITLDTTNKRVAIDLTTPPQYTLDVNGDINIPAGASFRINGTPLSTGTVDLTPITLDPPNQKVIINNTLEMTTNGAIQGNALSISSTNGGIWNMTDTSSNSMFMVNCLSDNKFVAIGNATTQQPDDILIVGGDSTFDGDAIVTSNLFVGNLCNAQSLLAQSAMEGTVFQAISSGIDRGVCIGQDRSDDTKILEVTGNSLFTGNISATGSIHAPSLLGDNAIIDNVNSTSVVAGTLSGTLTTAAQPNVTEVGNLTALNVTGNLAVDTNLLIVDSANNKVGINKAPSLATLDVSGTINSTGNISTDANFSCEGTGFVQRVGFHADNSYATPYSSQFLGGIVFGTTTVSSPARLTKNTLLNVGSITIPAGVYTSMFSISFRCVSAKAVKKVIACISDSPTAMTVLSGWDQGSVMNSLQFASDIIDTSSTTGRLMCSTTFWNQTQKTFYYNLLFDSVQDVTDFDVYYNKYNAVRIA